MSDKTSGKSIVPSGKTDPVASDTGGNRLIRRAASDALVPMNSVMNRPEPVLHRVGTREFHEEDFRQLQVWASELGMAGKISEFIEMIDDNFKENDRPNASSFFTENKDWCSNGRIERWWSPDLSFPRLSGLTHLSISNFVFEKLDLSSIPNLEYLNCSYAQLYELALQPVSALTELSCGGNQLTVLDLSFVPNLTVLDCHENQLTELDLASVRDLTVLWCGNNQLTKLELSSVPALTALSCENNQLTELDLSAVPDLKGLKCANNRLTELDIRCCLDLKSVLVDPWVVVHRRSDQTVNHPE